MDYNEMSKAYNNAKGKYEPYREGHYEPNIWKKPKPEDAKKHLPPPSVNPPVVHMSTEVDYSIVSMPNGTYIVARSHRLGSLDYDFVCECETRHDAREIVRALNK